MLNAAIEDMIKKAVREAIREELAAFKGVTPAEGWEGKDAGRLAPPDRLLTVEQAAELLQCSKESVYKMRVARVQLGPGMVRWSFNGLQKEIQRRMKK